MVDLNKSLKEQDTYLVTILQKLVYRQNSAYLFNLKASFNFNIGRFFKHANLLEINPILLSKMGGVLWTISSVNKHL